MIELKSVVKTYRTSTIETLALNHLNLTIEQGEFVSIMGPSGCGKSTLLNIIGMLDTPDSGEYQFNGQPVDGLGTNARARLRKSNIGFVFQNFNLVDELNVFDNVELPLLYQKMSRSAMRERTEYLLYQVGLSNRAKHFPQQLSGGQQQRVAIARALAAEPRLILADEPTGNLDSANGNDVLDLLSALNEEGTTIVMVTHSTHDAARSERTIQLMDGNVVEPAKTSE